MAGFAIYIHEERNRPHVTIHSIDCGQVQKRGVGDVTGEGFWVRSDSLQAAVRLYDALRHAGYEGGSKDDSPYCWFCRPDS